MSADFVVHPDGTVDYPDTGCYTMSAEEFARMSAQAESDSNISARDRRIFWRGDRHHGSKRW